MAFMGMAVYPAVFCVANVVIVEKHEFVGYKGFAVCFSVFVPYVGSRGVSIHAHVHNFDKVLWSDIYSAFCDGFCDFFMNVYELTKVTMKKCIACLQLDTQGTRTQGLVGACNGSKYDVEPD